jgi:glucose-6-phosphate-specific signal transduction histidine kinase
LDPADLAKARSFGIRGLHERASTVGGWVDLSSSAAGTSLILSVPLTGALARQLDGPESTAQDDPDAAEWTTH